LLRISASIYSPSSIEVSFMSTYMHQSKRCIIIANYSNLHIERMIISTVGKIIFRSLASALPSTYIHMQFQLKSGLGKLVLSTGQVPTLKIIPLRKCIRTRYSMIIAFA
jgi:hypothetical protein